MIGPNQLDDPRWAWAPYQPDADRPWNPLQVGHLYRRAAFGATWDQLKQALSDGPQRTIDRLIHPEADVAAFNRAHDQLEEPATASAATDGLRAWWLRRMLETPHPLLENMTLFWHNHFALSNARVNNASLMCRHVQFLRRHALGSFADLLEGITHDPVTFICLDAKANRKARPSEGFSRVLLEQYTVGPGQFSEQAVHEAARAFTGWFVLQNELRYLPREHDSGVKKLLGQEGDFDGKDAVRILLQQPATSRLLVRKLYRWLISETNPPPDALVAPLAADFAKDYHVGRLVETVLRSNLFFSPAAYRQKIKSPVEFALGIIKPLQGAVGTTRLAVELSGLGQDLYQPTTIKGWAGYRYWINRFTVVGRARLATSLLAKAGPLGGKLDPWEIARKHGHQTREAASRFVIELFLQDDLPGEVRQSLMRTDAGPDAQQQNDASEGLRQFARLLVALPEFHLA